MLEVKEKHKDLYWSVVGLLQDMKNGGTAIAWIVSMMPDSKTTKNLSKALYHINIATDILQGTLYPKDK